MSTELQYAADGRQVRFTVDERIYPRDAIFGAAYRFIDTCFVFLDRPGDDQVQVCLKARQDADLDVLAGEFANELLDQVLRHRLAESTRALREYQLARAFYTAPSTSTIDQLLAELDDEELAEDDIEIPWEQAHAPDPAPTDEGGDV